MWEQIGLDPKIDARGFGVRSPELNHGRQMNDIWMANWSGSKGAVDTWPGLIACYNTTIEFSCGWDFPEAYDQQSRLLSEFDEQKAWGVVHEFLDLVHHEYFGYSTVTWSDPYVAGPRVGEVNMAGVGKNFPELESFRPAK